MAQPLVFLGPPASGKGTQAQRLAESLGFSYLSTGGLLRRALKDGSTLGEQSRPYLDRGEYVPDEIIVPMVLEWVSGKQGQWILDGFPRTLPQAETLDVALTNAGKALPRAIVLKVPDEELRRRVTGRIECESCHWTGTGHGSDYCPKCGGTLSAREDDSTARFENRLREFQKLVVPTIRYYKEKSRAYTIDGAGTPDDIHLAVCDLVKSGA